MTPPLFFDLSYEIVTPLFMAGADPARPELRAASIRGAVRAWYRALDPGFLRHEGATFGAAFEEDDGRSQTRQSPFLLQVLESPPDAGFELQRNDYKRFDRGKPPNKTNGVLYTGYTLLDRFNKRRAFHPSKGRKRRGFTLRLLVPRPDVDRKEGRRQMHRVLASFWALGHLGALGSRANRGWGSVQLTKLAAGPSKLVPDKVEDLVRRYQPASTTSLRRWAGEVGGVLADVANVLGHPTRSGHALSTPHLGAGARVLVSGRGFSTWEHAVNDIGAELQSFRRDKGNEDRQHTVKALLDQRNDSMGAPLTHALQRTAFGLPYTMRYGITPKWVKDKGLHKLSPDTVEFNPGDRGDPDSPPRHASPLRLRIVRLDSGYHPVTLRMAGDPVGARPRAADQPDHRPEVAIGGQVIAGKKKKGRIDPKARPHPTDQLLDTFMNELAADALPIPVPE